MAQSVPNYKPLGGIDLKSNDINRAAEFLSGGQDARYNDNGDLVKRFGKKVIFTPATAAKYYGLFDYDTTDLLGNKKKELLTLETYYPNRIHERYFTVTNNSGSLVTFSLYAVGGTMTCVASIGGTSFFSQGLGVGNGYAVSYTVSSLISALDATAQLSCSTPFSLGSEYAVNCEIMDDVPIANGDSIQVKFWSLERSLYGGTASALSYLLPSDGGLHPSGVVLNGVFYYIGQYIDDEGLQHAAIYKYDGQRHYIAGSEGLKTFTGFPDTTPAGGLTGGSNYTDCRGLRAAGANTSVTRKYRATLLQIDKTGLVIESHPIEEISITTASNVSWVTFTLPNSFNYMNKAHAYTTSDTSFGPGSTAIPCDNGSGGDHSLQVGDIAYFWWEAEGYFVSREIVARTAGSITISSDPIEAHDKGGNINHKNNAAISANLRVAIFKTAGGSTGPYYLLDEIPPFTLGTHTVGASTYPLYYMDDGVDSSGAVLKTERSVTSLAAPCRQLATYNNLLVGFDIDNRPNAVQFSEYDNVESFPAGTNSFLADHKVVSAKETAGTLSVFGESAITNVYGQLGTFDFRSEKISEKIGAINHFCTTEIDEGILAFLSKRGPYAIVNGRNLQPLGMWKDGKTSIIEPYFLARYKQYDTDGTEIAYPSFADATATFWGKRKLLLIHIPYMYPSTTDRGSDYSETYVYDVGQNAWLPVWYNLTGEFGLVDYNDGLYGLGYAAPDQSLGIETLWKLVDDKGIYNYGDHERAITGNVSTAWESLGGPNVFKKFVRLALSAATENESLTWDVLVNTYLNYDYNNVHTSATLPFTNTTKIQRLKLKNAKANSLQIEYVNSAMYETFLISGWQLEVSMPFGVGGSAFKSEV